MVPNAVHGARPALRASLVILGFMTPAGWASNPADELHKDLEIAVRAAGQPPGYRFEHVGRGLACGAEPAAQSIHLGRNAAHGFEATFSTRGLELRRPGIHGSDVLVSQRLSAWGRAADLEAVEPAAPGAFHAAAARLEIRHGDLVEWYVNEGRGLEQGFTLLRAPGGGPAGAAADRESIEVVLALGGALEARLAAAGGALSFVDGAGREQFRYAGLAAWDAAGRTLPARMELRGKAVALAVDARDATYPITIDPLFATQEGLLVAADAGSYDRFGWSVALAGDLAVVGVPYDDDAGSQAGAAYVFRRDGATWSQEAKLVTPHNASREFFGWSVAIDGNRILVGAPMHEGAWLASGAVFVYVRAGSGWSYESRLTPSDPEFDGRFGEAVAISGDCIAVGSRMDDEYGANSGSVYVYRLYGAEWLERAKLIPADGAPNDQFGVAVALEGRTLLVGANLDDDRGASSGSAYLFESDAYAMDWTLAAKFHAADGGEGDRFGSSVALSGDMILIGAPGDDHDGRGGSAYVLSRVESGVVERAKLVAADGQSGNSFGESVATDGFAAVIGAPQAKWAGSESGAAYLFGRRGAAWVEESRLSADGAGYKDLQGSCCALSGDTVLVGLPQNTVNGQRQTGSVAAFRLARRWTDAGASLPGSRGAPEFRAEGLIRTGELVQISLRSAREQALSFLIIGSAAANRPLKGGLLVPSPEQFILFFTDAAGAIDVPVVLGAVPPSGTQVFMQYWIVDPAAPKGFAASNALVGEVP